jgi:diguanylate cyclase (GGDEF)-like protein/PAS domain S-box-containing protein
VKESKHRITFYAIYGFSFGLVFPLISTAMKLHEFGLQPTMKALRAIHVSDPLMLVVDMAPIVLSASFALIGIQAARFQSTSQELNKRIADDKIKSKNEQYFLEALINSSSFAIVRLDVHHHVVSCNQQFEELFGFKCEEILGQHLDTIVASDELSQEALEISKSVSSGKLVRLVSKRKRKDGSLVDVEILGVPVSAGGKIIGILGLYHDISDRINAENVIRESESRFKSLFQDSPISLWEEDFSSVKELLDPIGNQEGIILELKRDHGLLQRCLEAVRILDINQATVNLYNASSKDDLLMGLEKILVGDSLDAFRNEIISMVMGQNSYECEITQKKITGELILGWLRFSIPQEYRDSWKRVYISILDITDRKRTEDKMRFMSFHDALTGLYNRAYFEEELSRLQNSRQFPVSIIVCDLDHLKVINDKQGHAAGDCAIKAAASILRSGSFRKEDVIARTGGDEFMIILPSVDISENPFILTRIERGIAKHNASQIDDGLYRPISISCGFAVAHKDDSLEETVKHADHAMYLVKMKKHELST